MTEDRLRIRRADEPPLAAPIRTARDTDGRTTVERPIGVRPVTLT